tara:strand:+ start:35999 stop:36466 length:468 start_codon:yes stop_codon:yes gene_type:complete
MDERLCVQINSPDHQVFPVDGVYLTWIVPGTVNLIINNRYITFNFVERCFVMEEQIIHCLSITNHMRGCCVATEGARGGWCIDSNRLGKYQQLVITNNLVLGQYKTNQPAGKVVAIIEEHGLYTPEAKSFDDVEERFDCVRFQTGGRISRIWKVK